MNIDVTVCITTYNRKKMLINAIKSVLNQTYRNFELILVDDCSNDGTEEYVKEEILPLDYRIRYIRHETNKGLAAARNTAINNANGQYFTFLDDDDQWHEDFLLTMIDLAKKYNSNYIFCASIIANNHIEKIKAIEAKLKDLLVEGYTPPVGSQFYFTKTLKKIGGYDERIKSGVDHDLWFSLGLYDIQIIWLNRNYVKVNSLPSNSRMTFNFEKRITGINNSLKIWEKRIVNKYGSDFLECLARNYQYNTYKKFIIYKLKTFHFKHLIFYWIKLPKDLFIQDFARFLHNRIGKKKCLKNPLFMKCKNISNKNILEKIVIIKRNDIK